MPLVPWPQVTTGYPPAGAGVLGTTMMPVTSTGRPVTVRETYITR